MPKASRVREINWTADLTKNEYLQKIKKVIEYIRAGDVFQVNLSQRFEADLPTGLNAFAHYMNLRKVNPAPFAAYMNFGKFKIASPRRSSF